MIARAGRARPRRRSVVLAIVIVVAAAMLAVPTAPVTAAPVDAPSIVVGWGSNGNGEIGDGSAADSSLPVAVDNGGALHGKVPSTVAAGAFFTCAIAAGKPYCWGYNSDGALGNASTTSSKVPVAVKTNGVLNGKTITAISAGLLHNCVIADAKPYCWGQNLYGQLGNNTTTSSSVPVAVKTNGVLNGKTITAISAGSNHTCVVADAKPYCWGYNSNGQLGMGADVSSSVPVATSTSGVLAGKAVTAISGGGEHTCVVADAKPYCWGFNGLAQLGNNSFVTTNVPVATRSNGALAGKSVTAISAGMHHTCAIADAKPYCWGDNAYGQLGNNTTTTAPFPVAVRTSGALSGKTVTGLSAEFHSTCVTADDQPYCWGFNNYGQLGHGGTATETTVPTAVSTANILYERVTIEVSVGGQHTAALAMTDPDFCDVSSSSTFYTDIVWLAGVGITTGADGCFNASGNVTRQAMAAFLYRTVKPGTAAPTCTGTARKFTDVGADHPFCGAIEWLATTGITTGYANGTFNPTGNVTRQAMAAFLFRALNGSAADPTCTGATRTFADVGTANTFCGSIEWMAAAGISTGSGGGYNPTGSVSRQAMAAFLHRAVT